MPSDDYDLLEPGILAAVRRFWWLPLLGGVAFLGLGLVATNLQPRPDTWVAEASLVVQDPSTSGLFANSFSQPGRYVENQVAFLTSSLVADRAAKIASDETGQEITAATISSNLRIAASSANDVIRLDFSAASPEVAIAGVNAVSQAYQEVRLSEVARDLQASLDQLDSALEAANTRLTDIEAELATLTQPSEGLSQTEVVRDLLAKLGALRAEREVAGTNGVTAIDAEIDAIAAQLGIYQTARSIQYQDFAVDALAQEQGQLIRQVSELEQRRDELGVDAALAGSGVILDSPAVTASPPPEPETARNSVLGLGFGMILGLGAAYFLALKRRRFDHRSQPQAIIGAPLLADIPSFKLAGGLDGLPVLSSAESPLAEAHRFLAAALLSRRTRRRLATGEATGNRNERDRVNGLVIAIVSAGDQAGKSTTTANTGLACFIDGARVALVDADFGTKSITNMLRETTSIESVVRVGQAEFLQLHLEAGEASIDLLTTPGEGEQPEWLTNAGVDSAFEDLRRRYELILVDVPPVLSVAYASTLLSAVDGMVVMVPHLSPVTDAEDLRDALDLVGTPVLGYVYTEAPKKSTGALSSTFTNLGLRRTGTPEARPMEQ